MGVSSDLNEGDAHIDLPYEVDSLRQILLDTVMLPALSKAGLKIGQFPDDRFKKTLLTECISVIQSLELEARFNLALDELLKELNLDETYQQALSQTVSFELKKQFKHDIQINPTLFLDITDSKQDRLNMLLKAAQWFYKAQGTGTHISSTQAFNEVNNLLLEAQREHMKHSGSH